MATFDMSEHCFTWCRLGEMGKAKPAKHTSAELAAKTAAALTNKGGGAAGKTDRLGGKVWQDCGMLEDAVPKFSPLLQTHFP